MLHRLPPTGCESFIHGSSRVLAPPFCILLQLRTPFRLQWNHAHGCLAFLMLIVKCSTALIKTYLPKSLRSTAEAESSTTVIRVLSRSSSQLPRRNSHPLPSVSGIDPEPDEV